MHSHSYQYIIVLSIFFFSCEKWNFDEKPFFAEGIPTEVSNTSVSYIGSIKNPINLDIRSVGHCWATTNQSPSLADDYTILQLKENEPTFISSINQLKSNQIYYIRAYVKLADEKVFYGKTETFITSSIILTTESFLNKQPRQIDVVGRIVSTRTTSSSTLDSLGHVWTSDIQVEPEVGIHDTTLISKNIEGKFTSILKGLENAKPYKVRSYAIENGEVLYGNTLNFKIDDVWEQKDRLTFGKSWGVSFVLNGQAFVGLGWDSTSNQPTRSFFVYDEEFDQWDEIESYPGRARYGAVAFTIGDKAYVGLGTNNQVERQGANGDYFKDFWIFDASSMSWLQTNLPPDFPSNGVAYASAFTLNGKAYVGSGIYQSGGATYITPRFYSFDPLTNTWAFMPVPYLISQATCFVDEDKNVAYVAGGQDRNNYPQKDIWSFSPQTGWNKLSTLLPSAPRTGATSFIIDRQVYIGTGSVNVSPNTRKDFWSLDLDTFEWQERNFLPGDVRMGALGFSLGDRAFIVSGSGCAFGLCTKPFKDMWEYIPEK